MRKHSTALYPDSRQFWTRQVIYLVASSLMVAAILALPRNKSWLANTVQRFYTQRQTLGGKTDVATRKQKGYGDVYTYTTLIRQHCKPDDYFLIPPQRYLLRKAYRQGAATGYAWLYPSVLYYHLGKSVHLLEMTNPDSSVNRATYTFWVSKNQLTLLPVTDQNRALVMSEFSRYDPHFFAYTPQQAWAYYKTAKP